MEEFEDIKEIISKVPHATPPEDFTPTVMREVMLVKTSIYSRAWDFLFRPRDFSLSPAKALGRKQSTNEMSLYFMMVGFAHLIVSVVLFIGLEKITTASVLPPLVFWQPWIALFAACWLFFWGLALKKKSSTVVRWARTATLFYIEVVVINAVLLLLEFNRILLLVPFIATIAGITIAAGIFLALICGGNNLRTIRVHLH